MIPGYSAAGGSSATFSLTADNLVAGTPVLGTPTLTLNGASSWPDPGEQLLATVTSAPLATYSTRKLITGATLSMEVRRASDNATQDIGFVNGSLDVSAVETFCAGTDGFVTTLYDQSGTATDLTQATTSLQPQIVSSGSVMRNEHGHVAMYFSGGSLTATHPSSISNNNITLWMVNQDVTNGLTNYQNSEQRVVFNINNSTNLQVNFNSSDVVQVRVGDASTNEVINSNATSVGPNYNPFLFLPNIFSLRSDAGTLTIFRNRDPIGENATTKTASSDALIVGSSTCEMYLTDVILYPALSDADHEAVYDSINAYFEYGPTTAANATTVIPQRTEWSIQLYDWLETITLPDVTITRDTLTWDNTYSSSTQLSNLWLDLSEDGAKLDVEGALRSIPDWFVLDAGNGAGIEATGDIYHWYEGNNNGSQANNLAHWYSLNLPKAGATQGNPYYQHAPVGIRALVCAAVNMLGIEYENNVSYSASGPIYYMGGILLGSVEAYVACKDLLSASVQAAFVSAFEDMIARILAHGPEQAQSNGFGNMESKGVAAIATIYSHLTDAGKSKALRAVKKIYFGSETGTAATTVWNPAISFAGIFTARGDIVEGHGPETTYNGQAFKYQTIAWSHVGSDPDWAFLGDVINGQMDWYNCQTFPDPDAGSLGLAGPSGYAVRTGGSRIGTDQGGSYKGRDATAAASFTAARPLARHNLTLVDDASMVTAIGSGITSLNSNGFASGWTQITGTGAAHTNGVDYNITWTADTGTNELVITGTNPFSVDDRVNLYVETVDGEIPDGLDDDTLYWVVASSGQRIQLSTSQGGAAQAINDSGSGTLRFASLVYLTNTPDLSGIDFSGKAWWAKIDGTWARMRIADDANDYITVRDTLNIASGAAVDYVLDLGPRAYKTDGSHWPSFYPWHPIPDNWASDLKTLVDANDSTTKFDFENTTPFSNSLNDEFWYHMDNDGTEDFGWLVESCEYFGGYNGWGGGTLQAFWRRSQGLVILCKHDKSGTSASSNENTRVWSEIDTWAVQQTWGKDDSGTPTRFSTAAATDPNVSHTSTFSLGTTPKYVEHVTSIGSGEWHTQGQEANVEISGTLTRTVKFEEAAAGDGLRVTVTLTSDQADSVTELWETIPVCLRPSAATGTDAQVTYWDGGTWQSLSNALVIADWLKISRGGVDTFIHFTTTQSVRGPDAVYQQTYQEDTRCSVVRINMHSTTPGSAALLPASKSVAYDVQTTDHGLVATNPSVAVTLPLSTDPLPVGRRWAVRGTVTFFGASAFSVNLQYSDDNESSWNTVGAMSLVSGTPGTNECVYEYLGGSIPANVTHIRMSASDNVGSSNSTSVSISSASYSLVVEDSFTGSDATAIDNTWTGWTTNTTGNSYANESTTSNWPEVLGNKATFTTDGARCVCGPKVLVNGAANNMICEADVKINRTNLLLSVNGGTGIGVRRRGNHGTMDSTGFWLEIGVAGSGDAYLGEFTGSADPGADTEITIPSFSTANTYRLCLDIRGDILVWQIRNAGTDAVIVEGADWDADTQKTDNAYKYAAFHIAKVAGESADTVDDFKIWIP